MCSLKQHRKYIKTLKSAHTYINNLMEMSPKKAVCSLINHSDKIIAQLDAAIEAYSPKKKSGATR